MEKIIFEDAGLSFSSQLYQGAHKLAVVEITSENIEALIHSLKFLSPEVLKLQMSDLDSNILLMFGRVLFPDIFGKLQKCVTGLLVLHTVSVEPMRQALNRTNLSICKATTLEDVQNMV